jgi:hypothetical protein
MVSESGPSPAPAPTLTVVLIETAGFEDWADLGSLLVGSNALEVIVVTDDRPVPGVARHLPAAKVVVVPGGDPGEARRQGALAASGDVIRIVPVRAVAGVGRRLLVDPAQWSAQLDQVGAVHPGADA